MIDLKTLSLLSIFFLLACLSSSASSQVLYYPQTLGGAPCCNFLLCYSGSSADLPPGNPQCSNQGVYTECRYESRRKRCVCNQGYQGAQCQYLSCPSLSSSAQCSGRGTCNTSTGVCSCNSGSSGAGCQTLTSGPLPCPSGCNGPSNGVCDGSTGTCSCIAPWSGEDCSESVFSLDTISPNFIAFDSNEDMNVYGINLVDVQVAISTEVLTAAQCRDHTTQCTVVEDSCGKIRCTMPTLPSSGGYLITLCREGSDFIQYVRKFFFGVPSKVFLTIGASLNENDEVVVPYSTALFDNQFRPTFDLLDSTDSPVTFVGGLVTITATITPTPISSNGLQSTLLPGSDNSNGLEIFFSGFSFQGEPGGLYEVSFHAVYTSELGPTTISSPNTLLYRFTSCDPVSQLRNTVDLLSDNTCPPDYYLSNFHSDCIVNNPNLACTCAQGYSDSAGICKQCMKNFYKDEIGAFECTACPIRKTTDGTGAISMLNCSCEAGFFGETPLSMCVACDSEKVDCIGTSRIPRTGWYISPQGDIYPCLDNNLLSPEGASKSACVKSVAQTGEITFCKEGHTGPLCAVCEEGYYRSNIECRKCGSRSSILVGTTLFSIALVVLVIFVFFTASRKRSTISIIFKLLVNFIQIMALLANYRTGWGSVLASIFGVSSMGNFDLSNFSSYQCLVELNSRDMYLITLLAPFALLVLLLLFFGVYALFHRNSALNAAGLTPTQVLIYRYTGGMLALLFFFHPIITKYTLSWFRCQYISGHGDLLVFDMTIDCNSGMYSTWLGVACTALIIYCVGIPLVAFVILYRNRNNFKDQTVKLRYRFLFEGYTADHFYWELTYVLRRFVIAAISALYVENPAIQIVLASWVIFFAVVGHCWFKPFISSLIMRAELFAMIVLIVTLLCGIFVNQVSSSNKTALDWVLSLLNISVFAMYFFFLLLASSRTLVNVVKKIQKKTGGSSSSDKHVNDSDNAADDWLSELEDAKAGTVRGSSTYAKSSQTTSSFNSSIRPRSIIFSSPLPSVDDIALENPWVHSNEL